MSFLTKPETLPYVHAALWLINVIVVVMWTLLNLRKLSDWAFNLSMDITHRKYMRGELSITARVDAAYGAAGVAMALAVVLLVAYLIIYSTAVLGGLKHV